MKRLHLNYFFAVILAFTAASEVVAAPENPVVISPLQQVSTPTPEFTWQQQTGVTQSRLYIYDRSLRQRVHLQNYLSADICNAGVCSVTPDIDLGFSKNHRWFVRSRDASGWSAWTKTYFDYVDATPTVVTTISPDGPSVSATPEYQWDDLGNATLYRLYIRNVRTRTNLLVTNYAAEDICANGLCKITPDIPLPESDYLFFRVRGYNTGGWGPYSDVRRFSYTGPQQPPVALDDSAEVLAGQQVSIDVVTNDTDPDGTVDTDSITIVQQPDNGTVSVQATGTVLYTHSGDTNTADSFTYTVNDNDGLSSNEATVNLTVTQPPNQAPVALDDTVSLASGASASIAVIGNDSDPDGSLDTDSISIVDQPLQGTLTLQNNGVIVYTHNGGNSTTDSFAYTVADNDGLASNTATVNITMTSQSRELLVNTDFINQLDSWNACDFNNASVSNNTAVLTGRNCLDQSADVSPNQELELTCEVRRLADGTDWTGMGMSFYDENWNFISEPEAVPVVGDSFREYKLTGTVPAQARVVLAWTYSVSGMAVNRCSLVNTSSTEPPPPSDIDFCPSYTQSPLYRSRANTLIIGPDDSDWEDKIATAPANTEILLQDGNYLLDHDTILMSNPDVTVRSLSEIPGNVVIEGLGPNTGQSEGFMIAADRITIAELTMYGMRRHAIAMKPELDSDSTLYDTFVYNMDIYDTGTQHVKGSDGGKNHDAVVACNTIGYTLGAAVGDYNGAIGIFEGVNVVVRDNYIYNLTGDGTGCNAAEPQSPCFYESAPAIYMRASEDSIIERNQIIESFRGISLGLHNGNVRGVVRNNFIYRTGPGDMGISIELSNGTLVEHNTVLVEGYWAPIEVKFGTGGHTFRNNLTNRPIQLRGTTGTTLEGNIENATDSDFIAPGDPHLNAGSSAIGAGAVPAQTPADIDGDARSGPWDVGADQFTQ